MPRSMKRKIGVTTVTTNKKVYRRKIPRNVYTNGISYATRSGYYDIPITGSTVNEFGFGVQANGFLTTTNGSTVTTTSWYGASDIPALYDAYRITKFDISFDYNCSAGTTQASTTWMPYMYFATDYDDINSSAASVSDIVQKPDCVQVCLGRSGGAHDYKKTIVPKIAQQAYGTSIAVAYVEPKAKTWISTSTGIAGFFTDAQHYGCKVVFDSSDNPALSSVTVGRVRIFIKAYFELKHPQ